MARFIHYPSKRDQRCRHQQDLQHRLAAKAVHKVCPDPIAGDARDDEESVEQRNFGIGNLQPLQHEDAVERAGDTHREIPAALKKDSAAVVGIAKRFDEHRQTANLGPVGRILAWPRSPGEGEVPEEAGHSADAEHDAEAGVLVCFREKVQKLPDRKPSHHGNDAGDDCLATEKTRSNTFRYRVRYQGAVKR